MTEADAARTMCVQPETSSSFHICVGLDPYTMALQGTHLDPNRKRPKAKISKDTITLPDASLALAADGRSASLSNGAGSVLLRLKPVARGVEIKSAKAGAVFGGGDGQARMRGKRSMTKSTPIKAYVGNGVSAVPFIWHTSGWALLMLAEDGPAAIHPLDKVGRRFRIENIRSATDFIVFPAATMAEAVKRLADLTGYAPVPPRWAMGFLHCRWGYKSMEEIRDTWHTFRERHHPVDAFIYDFEWYTRRPDYSLKQNGRSDFRDFDWNVQLFSDPTEAMAEAKSLGIQTVGIRKPRLGNRALLKKIKERKWNIQTWTRIKGQWQHLHDAVAVRTMDFRRPEVRRWYWERNRRFMQEGMAGWWNDEGEQFPTLYYWWNRAQADGQARDFPNTRFWSINRAYSLGVARTGAAVWTGDSRTGWPDLRVEVYKILNYGIAGMPWAACDLGGFTGKGVAPSAELMTRYMQMGVFFPIMRTHSCNKDIARLPWNFGPEAEDAIRDALGLRYALLPYTYSLAHQAARNAMPIARPMAFEFNDKALATEWEQWMFGPAILAAPVLDEGGQRIVHLPRECEWYDLETGARTAGGTLALQCNLNEIPAWQRGGSILPLAPVIQNTGDLPGKTLVIQVATGANATFDLVEDDGSSLDYTRGKTLTTHWSWNDKRRKLRADVSGSFPGCPIKRAWRIRILGMSDCPSDVRLNGRKLTLRTGPLQDARAGWRRVDNATVDISTGSLSSSASLTIVLR